MPVRSSLCTYSPASVASTGASAARSELSSGKYSSILPATSSLSYGHYKPLTTSSNSSSFRPSSSTVPKSSSVSTSTLGRYSRLASHSAHVPSSSAYSSASNATSTSSSPSVGLYRPLYRDSPSGSSSASSPGSSAHNSFSTRYSGGGSGATTTITSTSGASPGSRFSSSSSSTGSLVSSASAETGYPYKSSLAASSLSSSAYSSGGSLTSTTSTGLSSSASSYTSPYSSRASRRLSSSAVSASPALPPGVPCGLTNLGNTCYMNASLQSLYALDSFRNLILGRYSSDFDHGRGSDKVLTHELSEVFKLLRSSGGGSNCDSGHLHQPVSPANFKYAFSRYQTKFSGFGQQDAQEFLRYLINGIHEESNEASKRPRRARPPQAPKSAQEAWSQYRDVVDDSPLVDLLVGQLCSTITCGECQNKSHCWDPFWDLSLPLMTRGGGGGGGGAYSWRRSSSQLSDVIDEFTAKEVLDSDERPVCSSCKRPTKSTKQISLARLPRLMILHLKKFTNDGYKLTSGEIQINKQLSFNGTAYQLKACISHHGHSSSSGHYTAHCEYASRWFHFDDGRVRDVTQTFDSNKLDDAYVLFYTQSRAGSGSGSGGSLSQSKL